MALSIGSANRRTTRLWFSAKKCRQSRDRDRIVVKEREPFKRAILSIGVQIDPVSASNFDPFERRVLAVALASSELAGIAETWRARVA
jgi:hypothetical protein